MARKTKEEHIKEMVEAHNGRYDLSEFKYVNSKVLGKIICSIHGEFFQTPNAHKCGQGCPKCNGNGAKKMSVDDFLSKANVVHGQYEYPYIHAEYKSTKSMITILCPVHGEHKVLAKSHIFMNSGCSKCSGKYNYTMDDVILESKKRHGDQFDYSLIKDYKNKSQRVKLICKKDGHGEFETNMVNHLNSDCGSCPKCSPTGKLDLDVIEKAIKDISQNNTLISTEYVNMDEFIEIECSIHGRFTQKAEWAIVGKHNGCKKCAGVGPSKPEIEVFEFVSKFVDDAEQSNRVVLNGKELDILIPSKNIAIEFCGLKWHSEEFDMNKNKHREKYDACMEQGIQLITIFEDEWEFKTNQVKNKLKSLLGCDNRNTIFARNTTVYIPNKKSKRLFLDNNHIQGDSKTSIEYALSDTQGNMIAVMTFVKNSEFEYTLSRYASSARVVGGFSKLLSYFRKHNKWEKIISFADLRWSNGNLYEKTGWTLDNTSNPDYSYIQGKRRVHKFNFRRKQLEKLLSDDFNPEESEYENCFRNKIYRIWDCGKKRYVIINT